MTVARMSECSYIPGCYRNLPCQRLESFAGYLLRLGEQNGYAGVKDLLKVIGLDTSRDLLKSLLGIRADVQALRTLASMAVGRSRHLDHYRVDRIGNDESVWSIGECRVSRDALQSLRAPICPICLASGGFAVESWDLVPVTVCTIHCVQLRDTCHECGEPISWTRSALMHCSSCLADFRTAPTLSVDERLAEVSADFNALAPFRVRLQSGIADIPWDEMFLVFKAFLHPVKGWTNREWQPRFVTALSVSERHKGTIALAGTRQGRCYSLVTLTLPAFGGLKPLEAIPRPSLMKELAYDVLRQPGEISEEVRVTLTKHEPVDYVKNAIQAFSGRPPNINTPSEIADFLSVDLATVEFLRNLDAIPSAQADHIGLDVDRLMAARRFLDHGLLTLDELTAVVGVVVNSSDLSDSGLLPRWNPRNKLDSRVRVDIVVALQLQIATIWSGREAKGTGVPLATLSIDHCSAYRLIAVAVALILSRQVTVLSWYSPFSWAVIEIDEPSVRLVMQRAGHSG
jgi:TniQ